mmetsp:Transcript_17840/g.29516  ORF Transcript_17840/g.29516 Transcript_17840/m.29516 type:complete len:164 (-) Transcript_17840:860-1351(-)|eukprot:CAMPEP_0119029998 /NCGR_PEP_ID=MMETSP1176-20130426/40807_1 /TAXON_ID=265551 /ORGANISM="Synedropsis recta cf, Strain CCMP1620" /LENGTH=163 /DNA_ID=CAMNT_0006986361 /DNA_START=31 /DNA_END=522 /DNA_ORIENTATION=+
MATSSDTTATTSLQALSLSNNDARPFPQHLPATIIRSYEIMGVPTDCWVQLFGDQIVVGVSQLQGKVGTYCLCQVEETALDNTTRFHVSTLLGSKRDDVLLEVYARRVTEQIAALRTSRSDAMPAVLLGISLKPEGKDPKMFTEIVNILVKLYSEAVKKVAES